MKEGNWLWTRMFRVANSRKCRRSEYQNQSTNEPKFESRGASGSIGVLKLPVCLRLNHFIQLMDLETHSDIDQSISSTVVGQHDPHSVYFDQNPLPKKSSNKYTRYLKFGFFSTYRRLFALIFVSNLVALLALVVRNSGLPPPNEVAIASSANLTIAILFRQEDLINFCYKVVCSAPRTLPLSIRRRLAKLFHYGGIHSGAGAACCVWFLLYTILITNDWIQEKDRSNLVNLILCYVVLGMLVTIIAVAHPHFRRIFHDYFEAGHRLFGWISLITFWVYMGIQAHSVAKEEGTSAGIYFVRSPNTWFFLVSTSCILLTWFRLRLHVVYPEFLSDHAIRLHFEHRIIRPFYAHKFSTNPLLEWHSFATIPDEDENGNLNGFSVLVSNAGDWTKSVIAHPPKKLWTRGIPMYNLLYTSHLFDRIVVVATGSGIGPCLSMFQSETPRRVFWSTQNPEKTYGPKIIAAVLKADPDAVVWDTRAFGRPNMVAVTYKLVLQSKAEAVFVVSNAKLSREVVYAMETRGIPAYAPIFDS